MRAGETVHKRRETFTVLRSAADGGRCHMEFDLAPGGKGPPAHTHEELEEAEVLEGSVVFWLDGVEKRFSAGDRVVIPAGCVHTFENASKTEPARARGTHGGRFERLLDQIAVDDATLLRTALYVTRVDPRASFMVSPVVRAAFRGLAFVARLRGLDVVPPTGAYGLDGVTPGARSPARP